MVNVRTLLHFLLPSTLSFWLTFGASVVLLATTTWLYIAYNPWFYNFFFSETGIVTLLEFSAPDINQWSVIFQHPVAYFLLVMLCAITGGCVAYWIVARLHGGVDKLHSALLLTPDQKKMLWRELVVRTGVQVLIGGLWVLYLLVTLKVLFPYAILLSRIGAEEINTLPGFSMALGGMALTWLLIHGHVIAARFCFLRPRLFS